MNRLGFIASFVAAIVAAALTLRMFRGFRPAPPEPEVNELPKHPTFTAEEDAQWPHLDEYSWVRPTQKVAILTEAEAEALRAHKSPPAKFCKLSETDFFPTWEI